MWTAFNWADSCLGAGRVSGWGWASQLRLTHRWGAIYRLSWESPEQVHLLTGVSASPEFLKRLTFICYNHNEKIVAIDTVRVRLLSS